MGRRRMTSFDEVALAYDRAINWPQRLEKEIPFILSYLADNRPQRVLDLACGSGRHLVALANHGCTGIGIDNSPAMIQLARELAERNHTNLQFLIGNIQDVWQIVHGTFDIILCLGNSLALLPGHDIAAKIIKTARNLLKENGKLIIQVLNFEEIRNTGFRFFPIKEGSLQDGRPIIFTRFFDHDPNRARSTLVMSALVEQNGEWEATVSTQQVINLDRNILDRILRGEGFRIIEMYGGYDKRPLDPHTDRSIISVATR